MMARPLRGFTLTALPALAAALLLTAAACSRSEAPGASPATAPVAAAASPVELLPLPRPDLTAAEAAVREQVAGKQAELDALLSDPQADPGETARAFGSLGRIYIVYEFLDAAEACFENARRLDPDDFRWHYLRGYSARVAGRLQEAAAHLERALALAPEFLPALLRLGDVRLELGEPQPARTLYERALALDPEVAAAHEGLGRAAAALADDALAAERYERALELEPEATALHYPLAQAYRRLGQVEKARFHLERRGLVNPRIPDPVINPIADLGESTQFYVMQGGEAMEAGRYDVAAAAYQQALERSPDNLTAALGLAYSLEKLGDPAGALGELEEALDRASFRPAEGDRQERAEAHRRFGALLVLAGRDAEAAEQFARCLELVPDLVPVRLKRANALARLGRLEEALSELDRVGTENPELAPEVLVKRATLLVNLGRGEEARAAFERAIAAAPGDPVLPLRYAEALDFLGDPEAAARLRRQAAGGGADGGGGTEVEALAARRLVREGRFAEAAEGFARAVARAPERVDLRFELATALGEAGRFDDALAEYAEVLEAAPDHAAAHRGVITILLLQRRYGQVRMQVQEALRLFPRDIQLARLQARVLATAPDDRVRDGRLALELASRIHNAQPDFAARELLALAYAELGRFDQAETLVRELAAEAAATGRPGLAEELEAKLDRFRQGRAWRATGPEEILFAAFGGPGEEEG